MRTIGVLGGMGPEATWDLCARITANTPATTDQEHPPVLCYSLPQIPPRTDAIAGRGPSPLPMMIQAGRVLVAGGAELLVMPCNTAHHYHDALSAALPVPFLHMIREALAATQQTLPEVRRVGLLASAGTVGTGIYHRPFQEAGVEVLAPSVDDQRDLVTAAIYGADGIKAGHKDAPRARLVQAATRLIEAGAEAIIAGCTELPLVLTPGLLPVPLIDPTEVLARAAVREALQ
ncbi:MAG: amino acid racemase [Alphaproteobacteria bacterium]|nr:amino acid racemase [Alphaproteobacteria bacterium]